MVADTCQKHSAWSSHSTSKTSAKMVETSKI